MRKHILCTSDILISLKTMRLIDKVFMLPYEIHTTDMALCGIEYPNPKEMTISVIQTEKLKIEHTSSGCINEVLNLMKEHLSISDAEALYHSKNLPAILITGDDRICKVAEAEGIQVAGILFILDKLIENDVISVNYAWECLNLIKKINKHLPQTEVDKRLNEWIKIVINMEGKAM